MKLESWIKPLMPSVLFQLFTWCKVTRHLLTNLTSQVYPWFNCLVIKYATLGLSFTWLSFLPVDLNLPNNLDTNWIERPEWSALEYRLKTFSLSLSLSLSNSLSVIRSEHCLVSFYKVEWTSSHKLWLITVNQSAATVIMALGKVNFATETNNYPLH